MFEFNPDFSTVEGRDYLLAGGNAVMMYYLSLWLAGSGHESIPWGSSPEMGSAFGIAVATFAAVIATEALRPQGFRGGS